MTIVKRGSKFRVVSKEGKNLGESETKAGAAKRLGEVEWFKHHKKCIVDPELVKGNAGMQQYVPVVFHVTKPKDKEAQKLDFPSTTKQMELRDVKQPEFPSTPFTGEAYAQSFHNPRPSNSVKDGTHVIVQGDGPVPMEAGPYRGEHGPDIQHKGSDYVPKKTIKSIMIAGKRVIIKKDSQGSDNANFRDRYPLERGDESREFDPNEERQKREDFLNKENMKEKNKAYEDAKRAYAPGNGPYGLAQGTDAYLGRSKDTKPVGEYTKEYPGAKVTFDQPIDPTKKPEKVFVHLTEKGREIKQARTKKSKGIMKLILQYTQNQPLAAGFKPLLAHLVKEEEVDDGVDPRSKAKKAMSTGDIAEKISATSSPKGPSSKSRLRLMDRAAQEKADNSDTIDSSPHPDFGQHGGYKGDTSKVGKSFDYLAFKKEALKREGAGDRRPMRRPVPGEEKDYLARKKKAIAEEGDVSKGAFKDQWIKQQETEGKDPLEVPKTKKKKIEPQTRAPGAAHWKKEVEEKSSRPNPIEGGIGDKLDYEDVDQNELAEGINVEQEHVKNSDDDEDKKKVKAADIAMDHLEEDDKYYTHLTEMERKAKAEDRADTQKKKLLKIDQATKSFVFKSVLPIKKGKGDPATSEKKVRHEKALEGRSEKAKEEWKTYEELEKLSEIKGRKLDRKRY